MSKFSPSKYVCSSEWEEIFTEDPENRSRVVSILSKKDLNINDKPIYLNAINRQSISFYRCCLRHKKEGVLVYPTHELSITPLVALEGLYYNYHRKQEFGGRDKILVISSRLSLRNEIRECFKTLKAGSLPIYYELFPVGRVKLNGEIVKFSDIKNLKIAPKLYVSPNLNTLPAKNFSEQIFSVIVESDSYWNQEKDDALREWIRDAHIPHLFWIATDPISPHVHKLIESKRLPYWGWNAEELEVDSQVDESNLKSGKFDLDQIFCQNYTEIKNKFSGITKVIVPVKEDYLNKTFKECRKIYIQLLRTAKRTNLSSGIAFAYRYIGCVNALEETISPLSYSEKHIEGKWGRCTTSRMLELLATQAEYINKECAFFSSYSEGAVDKLNNIYRYMLDKNTGKHLVILEIIKEALENHKKIVIVAKNDIYRIALEDYLIKEKILNIQELNDKGIYFSSVDDISNTFNNITQITTCVLYGCPRYASRHILSLAKAERLGIVVYESEIPFLMTMLTELDNNIDFFSSYKKGNSIRPVLSSSKSRSYISKRPINSSKTDQKSTIITLNPTDADMGEFTYDSIISDFFMQELNIESESTDYFDPATTPSENGCKTAIPAIKVSFIGGKTILLNVKKRVQIYDSIKEKVRDVTASHLSKGHLLILVDNSTKKTLASSIISKIESDPKMLEVVFYQKYWIKCLNEGYKKNNDTPKTLLDKLHEYGAKTPNTPGAVILWLNEAILGPNDFENIRRIGEIYGNDLLIRDWKLISASITRLRGIHVSLARKLNNLIPKAGIECDIRESENTIIDEELELSLEDFRNSISLERIISCEKVGEVHLSLLDRVEFSSGDKL